MNVWASNVLVWLQHLAGKWVAEIIAGALILVAGFVGTKLWKWIKALIDYHHRMQRALSAVARVGSKSQLREGSGLWLAPPMEGAASAAYETNIEACRILVVANAKGGVGKTTVSANIGARLAEILSKPVLMIDLDFQGTLSSMSIAEHGRWVPPKGQDSRATHLISGDLTPTEIANWGLSAAGQPNLRVVPAFYDLAQAENREMVEWLLSDRQTDIRFRLADILHDPAVRNAFSLIIIDSPPRLTTGAIQALAAGTHLLIPTILDEPSAEAVVTFVRQVETFRKAKLCPYIRHIGVVGSLNLTQQNTDGPKRRLSDRLRDSWDEYGCGGVTNLLPENTYLPRSRFFRTAVAGGGIAYLSLGDSQEAKPIKDAIIALAEHVRKEMRI